MMPGQGLSEYSPPDWLLNWMDHIPPGECLDLGAGQGFRAAYLSRRGFTVTAVDWDPAAIAKIEDADLPDVVGVQADIAEYEPDLARFNLILAASVLHFIHPRQLPSVADRLIKALKPNGFLMVEVLTIDDPSYSARSHSLKPIAQDTFELAERPEPIHYFRPGELKQLFDQLHVLMYEEVRRILPQSESGFRSGATLVARRLKP